MIFVVIHKTHMVWLTDFLRQAHWWRASRKGTKLSERSKGFCCRLAFWQILAWCLVAEVVGQNIQN